MLLTKMKICFFVDTAKGQWYMFFPTYREGGLFHFLSCALEVLMIKTMFSIKFTKGTINERLVAWMFHSHN